MMRNSGGRNRRGRSAGEQHRLRREETLDGAKLEALRQAAKDGSDAYARGDYTTITTDEELDRFFDEIARDADRL